MEKPSPDESHALITPRPRVALGLAHGIHTVPAWCWGKSQARKASTRTSDSLRNSGRHPSLAAGATFTFPPTQGDDKGKVEVEGPVSYFWRNFLVPLPPDAELRPGVRHRSACTDRAALSTLPRTIAIEPLSKSCHLVHDR